MRYFSRFFHLDKWENDKKIRKKIFGIGHFLEKGYPPMEI